MLLDLISTVVIFPCGSIIYWYILFNFFLHCNIPVKVISHFYLLKSWNKTSCTN